MRLATSIAALMITATSAFSADLDALTDSERDAFRAEVRAYLLQNPEVLMEAIGVLETRQAEAESLRDAQLAQVNYEALTNDGFSFVHQRIPDLRRTIIASVAVCCCDQVDRR